MKQASWQHPLQRAPRAHQDGPDTAVKAMLQAQRERGPT